MMRAPLPTLLSQAYVAYTIEFDNEWERRLHEKGWGPRFLVSYVMWANLMRWVSPDGIRVGELEQRAGVWNGPIHLGRMHEWWGYVSIEPADAETRAKPPRADLIVKPSLSGDLALRTWDGLDEWVQDAWTQRAGARIAALMNALSALEQELDLDLPDAMPVLTYADGYRAPHPEGGPSSSTASRAVTLGSLLARVLLAYTLEYERVAELSLAMGACVLRVLSEEPDAAKDVPARAGVRKESTDPALKSLAKQGYVDTEGKGAKMTARLTPKGVEARDEYMRGVEGIERAWSKRFGEPNVWALRDALEAMYEEGGDGPFIAAGLTPPPKCWRGSKLYLAQTEAFLRAPAEYLPHHPLLTHRGGWPDGA